MEVLKVKDAKDLERKFNSLQIRYGRTLTKDGKILITICDNKIGLIINEKYNRIENPLLILGGNKDKACGSILFRATSIFISDRGDIMLNVFGNNAFLIGTFALKIATASKEAK